LSIQATPRDNKGFKPVTRETLITVFPPPPDMQRAPAAPAKPGDRE